MSHYEVKKNDQRSSKERASSFKDAPYISVFITARCDRFINTVFFIYLSWLTEEVGLQANVSSLTYKQ